MRQQIFETQITIIKKMKKSLKLAGLALLGGMAITSCKKKSGCTDKTAVNYDAEAEENCCCAYVTATTTNIVKSGSITADETWKKGSIYELAGKVVVDNGATLTIEAGTIIKGRTGTGSLASALVIARGSKIMAMGTASEPIIFTSVLDNIASGQLTGTNLTQTDSEKWGGLIVLGAAPISAENGDTETQIEGIPAEEPYGLYGGSNAADNSGHIHYISIRHGGALIGDGNEINGLTLGGVGSGTMIHHVEVVANEDDGIECFGGTVNIDHALVAYQKDDGIDLDMNYSGTINNILLLQSNGDEAFEIDGPEGSTHTTGLFTCSNATVISDGTGSGSDIKSKAQGNLTNVSWWGYSSKAIKIRASFSDTLNCTIKTDAYTNLTDASPKLTFTTSEVGDIAAIADAVDVYTKSVKVSANDICTSALEATAETAVGNGVSLVSTRSVGATTTEFDGWSWSSVNGKY